MLLLSLAALLSFGQAGPPTTPLAPSGNAPGSSAAAHAEPALGARLEEVTSSGGETSGVAQAEPRPTPNGALSHPSGADAKCGAPAESRPTPDETLLPSRALAEVLSAAAAQAPATRPSASAEAPSAAAAQAPATRPSASEGDLPVPDDALPAPPRARSSLHALPYTALDAGFTGAAMLWWVLSEAAFKPQLAPESCRWCDRAPDGTDTLNAFDAWGRGARWSTPKTADTVSNVALAVIPLGMGGLNFALASKEGVPRAAVVDLLILAEAVAFSSAFNQAVKFVAGRERPFVHALPASERGLVDHPEDSNLSFFSGHSAFAFSVVAAAGTVAQLRGYRGARWVWITGVPLAVGMAYLRVAADKHYLTDVLVGAVVGSAFGVGVPLLLHPRQGPLEPDHPTLRLVALPGGVGAVGRF